MGKDLSEGRVGIMDFEDETTRKLEPGFFSSIVLFFKNLCVLLSFLKFIQVSSLYNMYFFLSRLDI